MFSVGGSAFTRTVIGLGEDTALNNLRGTQPKGKCKKKDKEVGLAEMCDWTTDDSILLQFVQQCGKVMIY